MARSRFGPLKTSSQRLKVYLPGILAHCRWPLGTKVIKPMAYGFRDDSYFFLKIRAAFPEIR